METLLATVVFGFFLGMRHATDADHVIAVSTIVSQQPRLGWASLIGLLWGLGHGITVTLVGTAIIVFQVVIPPRLGLAMEFGVAIMLVLLGVMNLTGMASWLNQNLMPRRDDTGSMHGHDHAHDRSEHAHVHAHGTDPGLTEPAEPNGRLAAMLASIGLYQTLRPVIIGLVHGLAGSAAVALLVLSTIQDPLAALGYLFIFHLGVMLGMMLITTLMAAPLIAGSQRFARFNQILVMTSGVVSILFGLALGYEIGFVNGLFTDDPHWEPE